MIKKTVLEQLILCVQSNDAGELLFSKQGDYTLIKKMEEKQQRSVFHRRTVSYTTTTAFSINLLLYLRRATSVLAFQKGRASGSFLSVKLDLCEVPKLCKF